MSAEIFLIKCEKNCWLLPCCQDVTTASFHLWAREVLFCTFECVWCGFNFHAAIKMIHLMATSRQDVPSFCEGGFVCGFVCVCMMFS